MRRRFSGGTAGRTHEPKASHTSRTEFPALRIDFREGITEVHHALRVAAVSQTFPVSELMHQLLGQALPKRVAARGIPPKHQLV
jgi:hypothetical protein